MEPQRKECKDLTVCARVVDGEVMPDSPLRFNPKDGTLNDKPYLRNGVIYSNPEDLAYGWYKVTTCDACFYKDQHTPQCGDTADGHVHKYFGVPAEKPIPKRVPFEDGGIVRVIETGNFCPQWLPEDAE